MRDKINNRCFISIVVFIAILIFQFIYLQGCNYLLFLISKVLDGLTNDQYLMIHHFIMFIILFIPTIVLSKKKGLDFGYHKGILKPFLICLVILVIYEIVITLIQTICGMAYEFSFDTIIFQLVFSGLGEEILYRSVPIFIFTYVCKDNLCIKIKNKYEIDFSIVLSAILFLIAHINISFNPFSVSAHWLQLINCFVTGIFIGYCYKKSKSIWQCMILHGIVNFIIVIIPMIASLF